MESNTSDRSRQAFVSCFAVKLKVLGTKKIKMRLKVTDIKPGVRKLRCGWILGAAHEYIESKIVMTMYLTKQALKSL